MPETLYRAMRPEADGLPRVFPDARALGVRPMADIPVDDQGYVQPGTGGMSVSQEGPEYLPRHRRPPSHGGTGPDPLWEIDEDDLPDALTYRLDEPPENHGLIEPTWEMPLEDFADALAESREAWRQCA